VLPSNINAAWSNRNTPIGQASHLESRESPRPIWSERLPHPSRRSLYTRPKRRTSTPPIHHLLSPRPTTTTMAALTLRSVPKFARTPAARTFASSAARFQAVPTEKPVLLKEFKIYRWVCSLQCSVRPLRVYSFWEMDIRTQMSLRRSLLCSRTLST
jgi:hypothetical protein